jgi:hypothetical protein
MNVKLLMNHPNGQRSIATRLVLWTVVALLFSALVLSAFEFASTYFDAAGYLSVIGGEGPAAGRCAYRSLSAYRVSSVLLAAVSAISLVLLYLVSSRNRSAWLALLFIVPVLGFGHVFEWACRAL